MISDMMPLTFVHAVLSLIGNLPGSVVVFEMLTGEKLDGWTALFFLTAAWTSLAGFFFPLHKLLPSHVFGVISLLVLPVAV
jgi:hypothetical protein